MTGILEITTVVGEISKNTMGMKRKKMRMGMKMRMRTIRTTILRLKQKLRDHACIQDLLRYQSAEIILFCCLFVTCRCVRCHLALLVVDLIKTHFHNKHLSLLFSSSTEHIPPQFLDTLSHASSSLAQKNMWTWLLNSLNLLSRNISCSSPRHPIAMHPKEPFHLLCRKLNRFDFASHPSISFLKYFISDSVW